MAIFTVRVMPLLVCVLVSYLVVYVLYALLHSSIHAKYMLRRYAIGLNTILSLACALVALYALADHNRVVLEIALSCLGLMAVLLCLACAAYARFLSRHPSYKKRAARTKLIPRNKK